MTGDLTALIVAYAFPPTGGAGVQRVAKLAKFLPDHGVRPSVLTVANPSVPVTDASLLDDLPHGLEIVKARTFEPGYATKQAAWAATGATRPSLKTRMVRTATGAAKQLLVPDPQILWQPSAQVALARRLVERAPDVVFISGPPFSQFLLAPLARLSPKTAVVLDYRDEWSTYRTTYEMMGGAAARVGEWLEDWLVHRAHAITTATEAFRSSLLERFDRIAPSQVIAIPNGYDPADFPPSLPDPPADRLRITYAGTVFKLTSPRGLLGAIRRLAERHPELARHLEVRFIGRIVDTEADAFAGTEALGVRQLGYVPHEQVLAELASSHLVLCLLDDVPGTSRIYPAKIFELMFLGRPVLTLAPPGALTELCERHHLGTVLAPRDEPAIASFLEQRLRAFVDGRRGAESSAIDVERFHRRALAGEFAAVFRQALARG
jgi:hypothetical protein